MYLSRVVLVVTGVVFAGYGIMCLLLPSTIAEYTGIALPGVSATVEVVAMYGGLQTGFGLLCLYCALRSEFATPGLIAVLVFVGSLALGRSFGLLVHGSSSYNLGVLAYEATTSVLAALAFARTRRNLAASCAPAVLGLPSAGPARPVRPAGVTR